MNYRALKYLLAYTLPFGVAMSFTREGWVAFIPIVVSFLLLPLLELVLPVGRDRLSEAEAEIRRRDKIYDWILWLVVPMQYGLLVWYFFNIQTVEFLGITWWGRTLGMGLLCGIMGINIGHELGHRTNKTEQLMAKLLLLSSLYPHFFIEHNFGHHKKVGTKEDPASARYNESVYAFWLRSLSGSYLDAWKIERQRLKRKKQSFWSFRNEMIRFTVAEVAVLCVVPVFFGWQVLLGF